MAGWRLGAVGLAVGAVGLVAACSGTTSGTTADAVAAPVVVAQVGECQEARELLAGYRQEAEAVMAVEPPPEPKRPPILDAYDAQPWQTRVLTPEVSEARWGYHQAQDEWKREWAEWEAERAKASSQFYTRYAVLVEERPQCFTLEEQVEAKSACRQVALSCP
ncbi:MAG: hypothetical protein ACRDXD_10085 [Acidimicrobiia bacterium]